CFLFVCFLLLFWSKQDADMLAGDEQAWKEAKEIINTVGAPKSGEDTNIYQLKLLDLAMDACINLGLWEEALHYGNRTLEPYR
ncbi:hypothetical protein E2320_018856, partial [Naja naja]